MLKINCNLKTEITHAFCKHSLSLSLFLAPPEILEAMPIQKIYHGETCLISCIIDRGNPEANVHWVRFNQTDDSIKEITDSYDSRFKILENGLQITNVTSADEGKYQCYVQNNYGTRTQNIIASFRGM